MHTSVILCSFCEIHQMRIFWYPGWTIWEIMHLYHMSVPFNSGRHLQTIMVLCFELIQSFWLWFTQNSPLEWSSYTFSRSFSVKYFKEMKVAVEVWKWQLILDWRSHTTNNTISFVLIQFLPSPHEVKEEDLHLAHHCDLSPSCVSNTWHVLAGWVYKLVNGCADVFNLRPQVPLLMAWGCEGRFNCMLRSSGALLMASTPCLSPSWLPRDREGSTWFWLLKDLARQSHPVWLEGPCNARTA